MNEQMIEAVARALCAADRKDPDETWQEFNRDAALTFYLTEYPDGWECEVFPTFIRWQEYETPAQAAIAAAEPLIRAQVFQETREAVEELCAAVSKLWGQGSAEHNIARDFVDLHNRHAQQNRKAICCRIKP